jgi:hypothetical protein
VGVKWGGEVGALSSTPSTAKKKVNACCDFDYFAKFTEKLVMNSRIYLSSYHEIGVFHASSVCYVLIILIINELLVT